HHAYTYVAVQVGSDVVVFSDSIAASGTNGTVNAGAEDAVVLVGRSLADIDFSNII
ncbi:MAG: hemolysin-type calcium-binding region protein, partial [Phenylobacterium sp.]|nr:hemolysin-type calcium-binding region protein [Phenylobacterium sp.]